MPISDSDLIAHLNELKAKAADGINIVHQLAHYGDDYKTASKATMVSALKALHPGCAVCNQYEG